jgi:hypothetical protein
MAQRSAMGNRIISFSYWSGGKIPLAFMVPALALFWDTGGLGRLCLVYYCNIPRHGLETSRCNNRIRKKYPRKAALAALETSSSAPHHGCDELLDL